MRLPFVLPEYLVTDLASYPEKHDVIRDGNDPLAAVTRDHGKTPNTLRYARTQNARMMKMASLGFIPTTRHSDLDRHLTVRWHEPHSTVDRKSVPVRLGMTQSFVIRGGTEHTTAVEADVSFRGSFHRPCLSIKDHADIHTRKL
jgi:hypothetical protein